jgi:hypothetical protein
MNRMKYIFLAACFLIPFALDSANATKIEIPLPELSGSYTTDFLVRRITRDMIFRFDRIPINIYSVSIKLQGFTAPGYWWCDWTEPFHMARRVYFTATMSDSVTGGLWRAKSLIGGQFDFAPFEFSVTITFLPLEGASWDFLEAGRAYLALSGEPEPVSGSLGCVSTYPEVNLYLATLIVDADYQIGVEPSTWGSIKALFSE